MSNDVSPAKEMRAACRLLSGPCALAGLELVSRVLEEAVKKPLHSDLWPNLTHLPLAYISCLLRESPSFWSPRVFSWACRLVDASSGRCEDIASFARKIILECAAMENLAGVESRTLYTVVHGIIASGLGCRESAVLQTLVDLFPSEMTAVAFKLGLDAKSPEGCPCAESFSILERLSLKEAHTLRVGFRDITNLYLTALGRLPSSKKKIFGDMTIAGPDRFDVDLAPRIASFILSEPVLSNSALFGLLVDSCSCLTSIELIRSLIDVEALTSFSHGFNSFQGPQLSCNLGRAIAGEQKHAYPLLKLVYSLACSPDMVGSSFFKVLLNEVARTCRSQSFSPPPHVPSLLLGLCPHIEEVISLAYEKKNQTEMSDLLFSILRMLVLRSDLRTVTRILRRLLIYPSRDVDLVFRTSVYLRLRDASYCSQPKAYLNSVVSVLGTSFDFEANFLCKTVLPVLRALIEHDDKYSRVGASNRTSNVIVLLCPSLLDLTRSTGPEESATILDLLSQSFNRTTGSLDPCLLERFANSFCSLLKMGAMACHDDDIGLKPVVLEGLREMASSFITLKHADAVMIMALFRSLENKTGVTPIALERSNHTLPSMTEENFLSRNLFAGMTGVLRRAPDRGANICPGDSGNDRICYTSLWLGTLSGCLRRETSYAALSWQLALYLTPKSPFPVAHSYLEILPQRVTGLADLTLRRTLDRSPYLWHALLFASRYPVDFSQCWEIIVSLFATLIGQWAHGERPAWETRMLMNIITTAQLIRAPLEEFKLAIGLLGGMQTARLLLGLLRPIIEKSLNEVDHRVRQEKNCINFTGGLEF